MTRLHQFFLEDVFSRPHTFRVGHDKSKGRISKCEVGDVVRNQDAMNLQRELYLALQRRDQAGFLLALQIDIDAALKLAIERPAINLNLLVAILRPWLVGLMVFRLGLGLYPALALGVMLAQLIFRPSEHYSLRAMETAQ